MTWFKFDDTAHDHPKVKALTDKAFRWWIIGLSYASRYLTNGVLPMVFWRDVPKQIRTELSDGRLWDWVDPHFQIHDYLEHQTSREDVDHQKARNREKSQRYRETKKTPTVTGDVTGDASVTRHGDVTAPENREQRTDTENRYKEPRARHAIQGSGAFESGSLPRDHLHHTLCGPEMKICLLKWQYEVLAKAYNAPENPHGTRSVISQFIEVLEKGVTPNDSIGPFSWVEREFHTYLKSVGKVAPKIEVVKPKPRGVAEILAEREAKKAAGGTS